MRREVDIDSGEMPSPMRRGWAQEMQRRLREMERGGFFKSDLPSRQWAHRRAHRGGIKRGKQ